MADCSWLRERKAVRLTIGAFRQAMAEYGIADHMNGKCPAPGCRCADLAAEIEARAIEIVEAGLGRPLPEEVP